MNRTMPLLLAGLMLPAVAAAEAAADPWLVPVDRADCARLVEHHLEPGVAYRPGVDGRGRPVAPADVGGGSHLALGAVTIPVEIDLARRYGVPAAGYRATAEVGIVTLRGRQVLFNGQPMSDFDQAVIAEACRAAGVR